MDNTYPGDAWSRLRDWVKSCHDIVHEQIMSGACSPDDYRSLCREARAWEATLNQMKLIQSGQDILGKHIPSPLRDVE